MEPRATNNRLAGSGMAAGGAAEAGAAGADARRDKQVRRRWAMLIRRVYNADPLLCPKCGGTMRIIAFVEARQADVIEKILKHCNLWSPAPPRPPPRAVRVLAQRLAQRMRDGVEIDADFLEHLHREAHGEQLELPWD